MLEMQPLPAAPGQGTGGAGAPQPLLQESLTHPTAQPSHAKAGAGPEWARGLPLQAGPIWQRDPRKELRTVGAWGLLPLPAPVRSETDLARCLREVWLGCAKPVWPQNATLWAGPRKWVGQGWPRRGPILFLSLSLSSSRCPAPRQPGAFTASSKPLLRRHSLCPQIGRSEWPDSKSLSDLPSPTV